MPLDGLWAEWSGSWCQGAEPPSFAPKAMWDTADVGLQCDPGGFMQIASDAP